VVDSAGRRVVQQAEDVRKACDELEQPPLKGIAATLDGLHWDASVSAAEVAQDAFRDRQDDPAEDYARADGYVTLAGTWVERSSYYLCAMTIFGIAIYLCGQSLGMGHDAAAATLEAAAVVLVVAGSAWVAHILHEERVAMDGRGNDCPRSAANLELAVDADVEEEAVDAAASFYGEGKRLLDHAIKPEEFTRAKEALECARRWRPEFASAVNDLSTATQMIDSPDANKAYMSLPNVETVEESTRLLKRAFCFSTRAGWTPSAQDRNALGFSLYYDGLSTGNSGKIAEASEELAKAGEAIAGLGKEDAERVERMVNANMGLMHLAMNQPVSALEDYAKVVRSIPKSELEFLASAITDLDVFAARCERLHHEKDACGSLVQTVDQAKGMLLRRSARLVGMSGTRVKAIDCRAVPHGTACTAKVADLDQVDRVVTALKRHVKDDDLWTTEQLDDFDVRAIDAHGPPEVTHSSGYWGLRSHCLPAGEYKVDAYVNGLVVGGGKSSQVGETQPYLSHELNMAACIPPAWRAEELTPSTAWTEGPVRYRARALITPGGRTAAFLLALFAPEAGDALPASGPDLADRYCGRAWKLVKETRQFDAGMSKSDSCSPKGMVSGGPNSCPSAAVLHKTWVAANGTVYVAFAFSDAAPGGVACSVASSVGNLYHRGSVDGLDATVQR
jgi:hypothetical protein